MTLYKPSLFVKRLVVLRDSVSVLDLNFHRGLNVIAGENSAGKTTVIRFLAYSLGAENIQFNRIALLCSAAMCEVEINGASVTLRREITGKAQTGLSIYWGALSDAINAGIDSWQFFGFRRSETRMSFSQILFEALGMPELRGDAGSNITMHQMLRMVYSDQETAGAELFRFERFDSPLTRQAVGEYLLGIDANELYELQLRAVTLEKEESAISSALKSVYEALGKAGTNISLDFVEGRFHEIGGELTALQKKLELTTSASGSATGKAEKEDNQLREDLTKVHQKFSLLKDTHLDIVKQITDSELLLSEVAERVASIEESISAAAFLGTIRFKVCPCCLTDVSARPQAADTCSLCNASIDESAAKTQLLRMRSELGLQLRESTLVKAELNDEKNFLAREIEAASSELAALESQFKRSKTIWRTNVDVDREAMLRKAGSLDQELKQLTEIYKLSKSLEEQREKKSAIAAELAKIREQISAIKLQQQNRREDSYEAVSRHLRILLKGDIPRAEEFTNPQQVDFDFGANRITIDAQQQFSASSMVYLRHSFRLALLFASLEKPYFRFPRLAIIDGIEDGGMEPDRSFNFQELILLTSKQQNVEHQIIVATSSIAASLDIPELVVGEKLTHENRSVKIMQ
ncbi:MAG TPA: AAA family ATPase [Polaromonas sp.]|uniref:AAA family ATPase n=1 Tax=Polaromonas sp. TaxID=1869339 RepID=UPI002D5F5951|nr:AAA family ATPase [Polaromonas sp.]HYW56540.1 AAA family ATPase [Polaromonas sp.]